MQGEKTIKKHVAIIHAYSLMSALQRKIVNVLLHEAIHTNNYINHHDSIAVECRTSFSSLAKAVNFNSNNTQYLKEAIDGLASLKIEWNLLKDKVPTDISFLNLRVLHGSPTFYQDGTFNFSFHKVMLSLADQPAIYGTIDLALQSDFESKYGHALYENSTRFINLQKSKIIQLDTFRKLLGVPEGKYSSMRELTRNAIAPSIEEVNERANFIVALEAIKIGRKITGFELSVHNKKNARIASNKPSEKQLLFSELERVFGELSEQTLKYIQDSYSNDYIAEKIAYTKQFAKKDSSGFYPIRYFIKALKENYQLPENAQSSLNSVSEKERIWQNKRYYLELDINTYKERLEGFQQEKNTSQINIIESIIADCENKLRQHLLERPNKENEAL